MMGSMWGLMASWFTPTSLFLFLNLVIGTLLLISRKKPLQHHQYHDDQQQHGQLARAPSLLDRVKSINLSQSLYKFEFDRRPTDQTDVTDPFNQRMTTSTEPADGAGYEENQYPHNPPELARTPSLLDRLKSINVASLYRSEHPNSETETTVLEPNQSPEHDHLVRRSKSVPGQPEKMKKSASERELLERLKEDEILERPVPATTRVEKWSDKNRESESGSSQDEEGVDAKADDFINKFKQQLKLQRLNSLKRFGEMIKGKQS